MKEITIKLQEKQVQNLFNFLGRVHLQGSESVEFVRLLDMISKQLKEQTKET